MFRVLAQLMIHYPLGTIFTITSRFIKFTHLLRVLPSTTMKLIISLIYTAALLGNVISAVASEAAITPTEVNILVRWSCVVNYNAVCSFPSEC